MIVIIRGLPGAGKSHRAHQYSTPFKIAADDFMRGPQGEYAFDARRLTEVHARCQAAVAGMLAFQNDTDRLVVVHNTFVRKSDYLFYELIARMTNHTFRVVDLYDSGLTDEQLFKRNIHGVPLDKIQQMRANYER